VFAAQLDVDDFTYAFVKTGITTVLEPALGIFIACLPMFPPTFRKMLHGKNEQDSRDVLSSSNRRLRSKSVKRSSVFRRLDDSYPLTDLENSRAENEIAGPDSQAVEHSTDLGVEIYPRSMINVKKKWDVRSDEAA